MKKKMKRAITLLIVPAMALLAILTVSCSSCGQGPPVSVAQPYEHTVALLTPAYPAGQRVIELRQDEGRKQTILMLEQQTIWWTGLRYRISIRSLDPATTELRGWVCDDSAWVPGFNVFTKRPLDEESFNDLLKLAQEHKARRENLRKAQQMPGHIP